MTQLAVGFKESVSGREQRTDGYRHHLGLHDFGGIRAAATPQGAAVVPLRGRGLEVGFHDSQSLGYLSSVDRDAGLQLDLGLYGRNITIAPVGGTLTLPANCINSSNIVDGSIATADLADGAVTSVKIADGTIQTADIAADAVQARLGSYFAAPTWSTSSVGWVSTPISSGPVACGGGLLRFDVCVTYLHNAAGAGIYTGLGIDGTVQYSMSIQNNPVANYYSFVSWTIYLAGISGTHTFNVWINNSNGTFTLSTAAYSTIFVTEQKR